MTTRLAATLALVLLPAIPGPAAQAPALALLDATVLDLTTGERHVGQTIVIGGSRITAVGAASDTPVPAGARVQDLGGRIVIPGLWDMHVHVLYPGAEEAVFPLLIANGVTGVRDMNGPRTIEQIDDLRARVATGEVMGPRIVAPGPLIDGPGRSPAALGPAIRAVTTVDEAREVVRDLHAAGADFIKVYNRLSLDLLSAICDEAARLGLSVAGHVPHRVSATDASAAGVRSLEHLSGILEDASPVGDRLREDTDRAMTLMLAGERPPPELMTAVVRGRQDVVGAYDPERASRLFAHFVAQGTAISPTLSSNRGLLLGPSDRSFGEDPRLKYVDRATRASWLPPDAEPPSADASAHARRHFARLLEITRGVHETGARILVGTDLGTPHVFPGFSLHDELELLVSAGLSPLEVLRAATLGAAEFLGMEGELGTVAPGKVADLVVVSGDPLENVGNTRDIFAVVLNGRLVDRDELDRLLQDAEERAR